MVCETMEELDSTWDRLMDRGVALMPLDKYDWSERYGWLQDRFRASWQLAYGEIDDVGQKITPL